MRGGRTVAVTGLAALAVGAVLAVRSTQAEADEARIGLRWNAPEACPTEAALRADVGALLAGSAAAVDARADVRRVGERWQVVLVMNGGERRLEADSCHALAEATVLIVAMAVDPERVAANRSARDAGAGVAPGSVPNEVPTPADASVDAGAPPDALAPPDAAPAPPPTPPAPAPPAAAPSPPPTPSAQASPSRSSSPSASRFAASAAATLDVGTLPTPSPGPALTLSFTPWPLRLDLTASYFPSSSASIPGAVTLPGSPSAPGGTAHFSLLAAALRACYLARPARFELGPCAGAELGLLQGSSQGIATTSSGSSPLFAFDAGFLAAWHFASAWAVFARGDALLEAARPTFEVNVSLANSTPVNTPSLVTGRASVGLELRF